MLKDYMGVPERTYNVDFNADDLVMETALIYSKIQQANKILEVMQNSDNLTVESAHALILPIYDYDKEFMDNDLLTIEGSLYDGVYNNKANDVKFSTNLLEIIKKFFRIFYNLFQKLYEKITLWLVGIEPMIKKLEEKISTIDFSKNPDSFNENENEKILNIIGVYALFNGKLDDNIIGRIITSFKNMKDFTNAINGYGEFINYIPTLFKDENNFDKENVGKLSGEGLDKKFVSKLPKFYKDITGQLVTYIENGTINVSGGLKNYIHDQKSVSISLEDLCVVSTNGYNLNIIYTTNLVTYDMVSLKESTGSISIDKLLPNVNLTPLNKEKSNMLINAIKNSDIKSISTNIRSTFKKLESDMNKIMKDMDSVKISGMENYIHQLVRTAFSENLSILNKVCFDYIRYNATLSGNCLKLIDMSLNKYSQTKEEEK